tara:strand:- start:510 stop:1307 length:798 start_codon:yes stop_codon:yes gene_type:complete
MAPYRFDVLSLTPNVFKLLKELGVIGRAFSENLAQLYLHNPRDFTKDRYRKVDDEPYGGGAGMVLKPEPFFEAFEAIPSLKKKRVLMMTPQGKLLSQRDLQRWALNYDQLVLLSGQYEGFDDRIRALADEEVSIGDFVLTGGELPVMTIINGVVRILPGTLGSTDSLLEESHNDFLLEHPHYTRPFEFRGMEVPEVLRSGDHSAIYKWRKEQRKLRTKIRRPDLFERWLSTKKSEDQVRIGSSPSSDALIDNLNSYEDGEDACLD